jgi:hypothetical protein
MSRFNPAPAPPSGGSKSSKRYDVANYGYNTAGIKAAIAAVRSDGGGGWIHFDQGTYNASGWTVEVIDFPLTITGTPYSYIDGVMNGTMSFLDIRANINISDLRIKGFNDCLDFTNVTTVIDSIRLHRLKLFDCVRAPIRWPETTANSGGGVKFFSIVECEIKGDTIIPKYGMHLETPIFERLDIISNSIENIREKGIYIGSTTIALQDKREYTNIVQNRIGNIYNPYGSQVGEEDFIQAAGEGKRSANAVQVMATHATIEKNYIFDIDNYAKVDIEGIYTKCKYAKIDKNHLINAGGSEAFIDIKGNGRINGKLAQCTAQTNVTIMTIDTTQHVNAGDKIDVFDNTDTLVYAGLKVQSKTSTTITVDKTVTTLATYYICKSSRSRGYGVTCTNNTLLDNRPWDGVNPMPGTVDAGNPAGVFFRSTGIKINNQDAQVKDNTIEGMTFNAIYVGGSDYRNLQIKNNHIRKIRGHGGIAVGGLGVNFTVEGNQIVEILSETFSPNDSTAPYGIQISNSVKNIRVTGNLIDSVAHGTAVGATGSPGAILVRPSAIQSVQNINIRNNDVYNMERGIYFQSNPADKVFVDGNTMDNVTTPISYSVTPSNIVIGFNNPILAQPAPLTDPSTVAGLYAWFDATSITGIADGVAIPQWDDKTANIKHATQATVGAQPLYVANAQNGKPGVRFSGAQNMKTPTWAAPAVQPNVIFVVMKLDSGYAFDALTSANRQYLRNSGTSFVFNSGVSLSQTSDTNYHTFTFKANGANSLIRVSGYSDKTGDAGLNGLDGLTLGSLTSGSYATGVLCEILVYNAGIHDYYISRIEGYLKAKWAL